MHAMRRIKSIASGRSSVSDPGGDIGIKRAKFESESQAEASGSSDMAAAGGESLENHMLVDSMDYVAGDNGGASNTVAVPNARSTGIDQLPREMHEMKIRDEKSKNPDDKEIEASIVNGSGTETGHIISTTISSQHGQEKQTIRYRAERVVGTGSFGVVFQATCLETGEAVAIKKVLQDRRYKNRELQIMRMLNHPNVVQLKHCFFSTTDRDELYLNLVLEYVPETVYRITQYYSRSNQRMPLIYVKLYTYQMCRSLAYIHNVVGVCHRDIKPQNLLVDPRTHQLKLCDFGSAKKLVKGEPNISYICSRYYRAPELIFGATEYTTAIDIWSLGCVLAELLLGLVGKLWNYIFFKMFSSTPL